MSTRARIGIVRPNGSVLSIYTHSDGYVRHHGPILLNHYDTSPKVLALMKMGDASQLCGVIEECVFYVRDRSETCGSNAARTNKNQALYYQSAPLCNADYLYLFLPDTAVWLVAENDRGTPIPIWRDLRNETITERLTA